MGWLRVIQTIYVHALKSNEGLAKHKSTHARSQHGPLLGSPQDTPKLYFTFQAGRNFGPSKLLRQPNRSERRRTVSVPG
jgi:hypothetical protein